MPQSILDVFSLKNIILAFVICNARMAAFCQISIFFSTQYITGIARNCIILSLSIITVPLVLPIATQNVYNDTLSYIGFTMKEAFLGSIIGLMSNFVFYVAQGAGFLIDTQRGGSMASIFDPLTNSQTSPIGDFLLKFAMVLALIGSAFLSLLELIYDSYIQWPIFSQIPSVSAIWNDFFLKSFSDGMFYEIATLCGPVLFILFLSEFGLGMVTRFAPQLNVFFLAMPVKCALAILFLILYLTFLIDYFKIKFAACDHVLHFFKMLKSCIL